MFVQKKLKNLFDNYITGFPANNLSQSRYVQNVFVNKIVTEYDVKGAQSRIEIEFDEWTNNFDIKKWDGDFRSVHIMVSKRLSTTDEAEKTVKKLYADLALTSEEIVEIAQAAPAPEINPTPSEVKQ